MCDFKVGDEVVCVRSSWLEKAPAWMFWTKTRKAQKGPKLNQIYTVTWICMETDWEGETLPYVALSGFDGLWTARSFRKVQRRDLGAWLETSVPNTDTLDKSRRAKTPEHV